MRKLKNKNIFHTINKNLVNECNHIDEMYKNIPFIEEIDIYTQFKTSIDVQSLVGGCIGVHKQNIFSDINKDSRNEYILSSKDKDVESILIKNSMEQLLDIVKFNNFSIHRYLNILKIYKNKSQKEIIVGSNHKEKYIEAVFANEKTKYKRHPSRDCIIGISFAFELNLVETNYLLRAAGYNDLYIRNKRDLIIAKSILEKLSINELNAYLLEQCESKIGNLDDNESYI